jgi:hypothetical protein
MYSEDMASLFDKKDIKESIPSEEGCVKYEIAKAYHTEKELLADNDKEIYFDKEYDTTQYSMLSDYEKDMLKMSADKFITFLVEKLKVRLRINDYEAEYLAETLIAGAKRVTEGQYAVFYDTSKAGNESDPASVGRIAQFYKRTHNKWVHDENADETWFVADTSLLCNIQETCIETSQTSENKPTDCITTEKNKADIMNRHLKNILGEFDRKYEISRAALLAELTAAYEASLEGMAKLDRLNTFKVMQYNNQKFQLGVVAEKEAAESVVSPYAKLRDLILSQGDFFKKQQDIVRFKSTFTREA